MLRTFDDWSKLGYKIKKGSKAVKYDGVNMFSSCQVEKYIKKSYYSNINLGDHKGFDNPHWDYRYADVDDDDPINFDRWM